MIWRQHIHKVVLRLPDSWSNWNFEMLVFEERGKPGQKTPRSKGENQYEYANVSHNFANLKFCEVTLLLSFSLFLSGLHEHPFIITITCDSEFSFLGGEARKEGPPDRRLQSGGAGSTWSRRDNQSMRERSCNQSKLSERWWLGQRGQLFTHTNAR